MSSYAAPRTRSRTPSRQWRRERSRESDSRSPAIHKSRSRSYSRPRSREHGHDHSPTKPPHQINNLAHPLLSRIFRLEKTTHNSKITMGRHSDLIHSVYGQLKGIRDEMTEISRATGYDLGKLYTIFVQLQNQVDTHSMMFEKVTRDSMYFEETLRVLVGRVNTQDEIIQRLEKTVSHLTNSSHTHIPEVQPVSSLPPSSPLNLAHSETSRTYDEEDSSHAQQNPPETSSGGSYAGPPLPGEEVGDVELFFTTIVDNASEIPHGTSTPGTEDGSESTDGEPSPSHADTDPIPTSLPPPFSSPSSSTSTSHASSPIVLDPHISELTLGQILDWARDMHRL